MKKILSIALMASISFAGFAKDEVYSADKEALAKSEAEKEFIVKISAVQKALETAESKKISLEVADTISEQFFLKDDLVDVILKFKKKDTDRSANKIFKELSDDIFAPTKFAWEAVKVGKTEYNVMKSKKKENEQIDFTKCTIPVEFQTRTTLKDNRSDVKCAVEFVYQVEYDYSKKNDAYKASLELKSITAKEIDFLNSDLSTMKQKATEYIKNWYTNLPNVLEEKYTSQAIKPIEGIDAKVSVKTPGGNTFTASNLPDVKIAIDPFQFIGNPDIYDDPEATLVLAPSFDFEFDKELNIVKSNVKYKETIIKPISTQEKKERFDKSSTFANVFAESLTQYVADKNNDNKEILEALFGGKDKVVEVSYKFKNGKEKIDTVKADKYLKRLKGSSMIVNASEINKLDNNFAKVECVYEQVYESKSYSDYTIKSLILVYDEEKGQYFIEEIKVVPNSTVRR